MRAAVAILLLTAGGVHAAEISSNGLGGGPWSDPATWRGKALPGPDDDVVVRKLDVVAFDRPGEPTKCRKLQIDPKGVLLFRTGAGSLTLEVSEGIDTFGTIKLDGTRSDSDRQEIRLTGAKAEQRKIKLSRGGGLLLYGKQGLREGTCNVGIAAPKPAEAKEAKDELPGLVEADGGAGVDWQRARVDNIKLHAKHLDNTGAKPGERINVIGCVFTGQGHVQCEACDTPVLAKNSVGYVGPSVLQEAGLAVYRCPLAEIKGNRVTGGYVVGIGGATQSDAVVIGNSIEKCTTGFSAGGGNPNLMVKDLTVRNCETGVRIEGSDGVLENVVVEGSAVGFDTQNARLQVINLQVNKLAAKGQPMLWMSGQVKMLNCNVKPEDIKIGTNFDPTNHPPVAVVAQEILVVGVKDAPAAALVEVRTRDAPAGASDPNVRNSPAPVVKGATPLAGSVAPLIVTAWSIDLKGKALPAPEYVVKVLGPAAKEGETRPVLATVPYRPTDTAFRSAEDTRPTLEVRLK